MPRLSIRAADVVTTLNFTPIYRDVVQLFKASQTTNSPRRLGLHLPGLSRRLDKRGKWHN